MRLSLGLGSLASAVAVGEMSARELVEESLDKISSSDLNSVLESSPDALSRAAKIDADIKAGRPAGRLAGIPFAAKDNFLTHHTHTTAASNILKPYRAPYQATVIEKLESEGAVLVAKTNLDAFAHGSSTENSDFGPTKNPHDPAKVPGGSSGGSAAAVAAGEVAFALGTDTGGSIRLPAAYCGTVGLKPTYGLVSRYGVIAMGSSVDVIGPLTRTAADAALVLDIISGRDGRDSTTIERDSDPYTDLPSSAKGLKVGLVQEYMGAGVDDEVKTAIGRSVSRLKELGAKVEEVSLPAVELALPCYYVLVPAEISSNLARYDGIKYGFSAKEAEDLFSTYELSRDQGFGTEAKRRIAIGTYVLSSGYYDAYYKKAQTVRTLLVNEFAKAFGRFDMLLGPTAPGPAFDLGQKTNDPLEMYLTDVMTVAANLVGCCAISLPVAVSAGSLPIGVQLIAPQKQERHLLSVASMLESRS